MGNPKFPEKLHISPIEANALTFVLHYAPDRVDELENAVIKGQKITAESVRNMKKHLLALRFKVQELQPAPDKRIRLLHLTKAEQQAMVIVLSVANDLVESFRGETIQGQEMNDEAIASFRTPIGTLQAKMMPVHRKDQKVRS